MKTYDELKALIEQRGVHEVFGAYGEGFGIEQNADELAQFLVHMQHLGVESVLEIGTGWKAGLARFLAEDMGWAVTSVDIHDYGHQFGGITFLPMSDSEGALSRWEGSLQADLLIIDGDHSYEAVKADHEWYATWAQKVIAFHDIAGLRDCEDVKRYWDEIAYESAAELGIPEGITLKPGYYEIIADTPERGGIGYIVLSETLKAFEDELAKAPDIDVPSFSPVDEPPVMKAAPKRKPAPAKKPAARKAPTGKK